MDFKTKIKYTSSSFEITIEEFLYEYDYKEGFITYYDGILYLIPRNKFDKFNNLIDNSIILPDVGFSERNKYRSILIGNFGVDYKLKDTKSFILIPNPNQKQNE